MRAMNQLEPPSPRARSSDRANAGERRDVGRGDSATGAASTTAGRDPLGAKLADRVVAFLGSWRFIVIQTILVALWIVANTYLWFHFDPFPFILLNLAFSTQAAYAAPLILLAGNRAAARDRRTIEHAAAEADIEEAQNERLLAGNESLALRIESLERQVLALERSILAAIENGARATTGGSGTADERSP
jgi:uncharacterized membrane protein